MMIVDIVYSRGLLTRSYCPDMTAVESGIELPLVSPRSAPFRFFHISYPAHPRVVELLDIVGFGGVYRSGASQQDKSLITAFVKRWRPETHTFHLPAGDVTVTLQDVEILWGLRVDREAVVGVEQRFRQDDVRAECGELLGFIPDDQDFLRGGHLRVERLDKCISDIVNAHWAIDTDDDDRVYTQYF